MADQEWVVVKSRVTRQEATALATAAAQDQRSISATIRLYVSRALNERAEKADRNARLLSAQSGTFKAGE